MQPTDILMHEHRVIEQVLACLDEMAVRFKSAGRIDEEPARQAIEFFRNFADKYHHAKEEGHLFPAFEVNSARAHCNPLPVMLMEHDHGRAHVIGMEQAIEAASKGDAGALNTWVQHATGLIGVLEEHIMKEDRVLFPMTNSVLTAEDQSSLAARFDEAEAEMGRGMHAKYVAIANDLADRFDIEKVDAANHTAEHG